MHNARGLSVWSHLHFMNMYAYRDLNVVLNPRRTYWFSTYALAKESWW